MEKLRDKKDTTCMKNKQQNGSTKSFLTSNYINYRWSNFPIKCKDWQNGFFLRTQTYAIYNRLQIQDTNSLKVEDEKKDSMQTITKNSQSCYTNIDKTDLKTKMLMKGWYVMIKRFIQ